MKKWQMILGLALAVVLTLGLSAAAFAQTITPPAAGPSRQGPPAATDSSAGTGPGAGYGMRFGMNGASLVEVTARVTGLTTAEVVAELQSGRTFAEVAEAHGKTAENLVAAFLEAREALLDQAVAEGRITQEVADQMLATMRANVTEHVNSTWQPHGTGARFTGTQPGLGPRWNR